MIPALRLALVGGAVFLVQWLVLGNLPVFGAVPDAVLLFVAWTGLRFGRRYGLIAGFVLGFLLDATYDTWGMQMFVKSLVGFLVAFIPTTERETLLIQPQQAFTGGLLIALVHNGLLVLFQALAAGGATLGMVTGEWLGGALYTAVVAFVAALVVSRRI